MRIGAWGLLVTLAVACSSSVESEPGPEPSVGGDIEPPGFVHTPGKSDAVCVDGSCPNGESQGDHLLAPVAHFLVRGADGRLAASFHPDDLLSVPEALRRNPSQLRLTAMGYLSLLIEQAAGSGHKIRVNSGFRSFCTQCTLFWGYVGNRDKPSEPKAADNFSARAGHSEHQLGTAVDLHGNSGSAYLGGPYVIPDTAAAQPKLYAWMDKHAYEYGFVNSYPPQDHAADHASFPGSTRTYRYTRYKVEPWHWRFVGKHAALVHRELYLATGIRVSTHELVELLMGKHPTSFDDHAVLVSALDEILQGRSLEELEAAHTDDVKARSRALVQRCQSLGWISTCDGSALTACDKAEGYADRVECAAGCAANTAGKHDGCIEWVNACGDAGKQSQCQDGTWLLRCDPENQSYLAQKLPCAEGCSAGSCGDAAPPPPPPQDDPCENADGGNGLYCGGGIGGDANTLYDCQNKVTASQLVCPAGCSQNPPGQADSCL